MSLSSDYMDVVDMPSSNAAGLVKKPIPRARKCTLTQQQKNQKRQRATPEQLRALSEFFSNTSSTPTADQRRVIGENIDMTPRSVQIWFQNKRAKSKKAKKHVDCDFDGSDSHLGRNVMLGASGYYALSNPSLTSLSPAYSSRRSTPAEGERPSSRLAPGWISTDGMGLSNECAFSNLCIEFQCTCLTMGPWKQVNIPNQKVIVKYQPEKQSLIYIIESDTKVGKVVIPFAIVENLSFFVDEVSSSVGHIRIMLRESPQFFTRVLSDGLQYEWRSCENFTNADSSWHNIEGPYSQLQRQLHRLYSFQPSKVSQQLLMSPPLTSNSEKSSDREKLFFDVDITAGLLLNTPNGAYSEMGSPLSAALPKMASSLESSYANTSNCISMDTLLETPLLPVGLDGPSDSDIRTPDSSERNFFNELDMFEWASGSQSGASQGPALDKEGKDRRYPQIQGDQHEHRQGETVDTSSTSPIHHPTEAQLGLSLKLGLDLDLDLKFNDGQNYTVEPVDLLINNSATAASSTNITTGYSAAPFGAGGTDKLQGTVQAATSSALFDINQFIGI